MSSRKPRKGPAWAPDSTEALFDDGMSDDDSRDRRKRALHAQEEEQALLHRTVVASKRQNLELQYERVRRLHPVGVPNVAPKLEEFCGRITRLPSSEPSSAVKNANCCYSTRCWLRSVNASTRPVRPTGFVSRHSLQQVIGV